MHYSKQYLKILPVSLRSKLEKCLWNDVTHPIGLIAYQIHSFFRNLSFMIINDNTHISHYSFIHSPCVTVFDNFDSLCIPLSHPSRSMSDTYYLLPDNCLESKLHSQHDILKSSETLLLRTHATAHQHKILCSGVRQAIWTVNVFRKDEVNRHHSPIFHQTDGIRLWDIITSSKIPDNDMIIHDLKYTLSNLISIILNQEISYRWTSDTFPFTDHSIELEVLFPRPLLKKSNTGPHFISNEWIEILGGGIIKSSILKNAGLSDSKGWAFGLGIERLAMLAYEIPDIRYFWSTDTRFTSQFLDGKFRKFKPFSVYPNTVRDLSVWFPLPEKSQSSFLQKQQTENRTRLLSKIITEEASDLVASIALRDYFQLHQKESLSWRIIYQSFERTLHHDEVNMLQHRIITRLQDEYGWNTRGG